MYVKLSSKQLITPKQIHLSWNSHKSSLLHKLLPLPLKMSWVTFKMYAFTTHQYCSLTLQMFLSLYQKIKKLSNNLNSFLECSLIKVFKNLMSKILTDLNSVLAESKLLRFFLTSLNKTWSEADKCSLQDNKLFPYFLSCVETTKWTMFFITKL